MTKPIAFYPELARELGDIPSAIYYQQLYYWSDKGGRKDGFIYKTKEEIEQETTLTRDQQDRIRKSLVEKGWIKTKLFKANGAPTLHYKCLVSVGLIIGKPTNGKAGNPLIPESRETRYSITENTTENNNNESFFSSEEPEYTEPPKETYKTKAKIYASLGMKYTPPPKSTAQELAWNTEMLARYAKEKAMETLGINIYINKTESSAHWTAIKRAAKNLGLEESKSLVNFYLNSEKCQKYGADPSTMFSDHSINLYQASKRKIKSYR